MLASPEFAEPVLCHRSVCPEILESTRAQVDAEVTLQYQAKTNTWGFVIREVLSISGVPYAGPAFKTEKHPMNENPSRTSTHYRASDLIDPVKRERIAAQLNDVVWEMKICRMSKHGGRTLVGHPSFSEEIVFMPGFMIKRGDYVVGQNLPILVTIKEKGGRFSFIAKPANVFTDRPVVPPRGKKPKIEAPSGAPSFPKAAVSKLSRATAIPSVVHIYIDEAWPGCQNRLKKDTGVIAGIVWMDATPDYTCLTDISNHLHANGDSALKGLLQCEKAFPFAFPIRLSEPFDPNSEKYLVLLADSVVLLLGWVLPRPGRTTKVCIHAELYGAFKVGSDETAFFQALLAGASMTQNKDRFSMWDIERVEWQDKSFEYIPYGDLVGYLFAETAEAKQMAKQFRVAKWPGCVPFSPDLLPVLRDLDAKEPAGVAGALFRLAALCGESNLFRTSLADTIRRAKEDAALRDAILERICDEFENKNRDLRRIALVADAFFEAFPDADFEGRPKLRFLRLLANLQKANHDGDPASAEAALRGYEEMRREMEKRDRELCAYGDLNLAVHFNDRFSFEKAETVLRACRDSPEFPFHSAQNRGRILSSLGQSAALTGRPAEADALFREALDAFAETGGELADEADQTRVYRAFASLDALDKETPARVAEALTVPIDEAVRRPEAIADHPFHEHLLVKTIWHERDSDVGPKWIRGYLSTSAIWSSAPQHPWELILLYRGLLAWKTDPALANRCFGEWDEWFRTVPHGGTLALIRGFGLVAMKRHCGRTILIRLEELLAPVKNSLPDTAPTVDALLRIANDSSEESLADLWKLLPFNYK